MAQSISSLMIGWEYPPHNSGGLGVACQGLTQALAVADTKLHFTLPFSLRSKVMHMNVLECIDESWTEGEYAAAQYQPPFEAYAGEYLETQRRQSLDSKKIDSHTLLALPRSEMEQKVYQYARAVASHGSRRSTETDVIHAHDWMSFPAGVQLKHATGKPLISHIHSTEFDRSPHGGSDFIMKTEYEGLHASDIVIAVSHYTKRLLVQKYDIAADKIEVVHNGIVPPDTSPNPGDHHFAQQRPIIVFLGRLTGQKGVPFFLDVAAEVLQHKSNALFVIAGHGDMYHQLLLTTAHHGLSASVLFSGFVRGKDKDMLLDRASVFVMPSRSEPFGLVALEAAQRHTPVIVSKNSGVAEVLPSAVSLDFWDIHAMRDNILHIINDDLRSRQMVDNHLSEVDSLSWDKAANKVRAVYRRAFLGR